MYIVYGVSLINKCHVLELLILKSTIEISTIDIRYRHHIPTQNQSLTRKNQIKMKS